MTIREPPTITNYTTRCDLTLLTDLKSLSGLQRVAMGPLLFGWSSDAWAARGLNPSGG